jgi:hypothetical protein
MKPKNKIIEGLEAAHRSAQCTHAFEWISERPADGGVVGYCPRCRCRYTAWPGTVHYEEILAVRPKQEAQR